MKISRLNALINITRFVAWHCVSW